MYYTGFADEAAKGIDGQIAATTALGWSNIEARAIDGVNLTDISDLQFDLVAQKLSDAGVTVNCFGSAISNWAKDVLDPADTSFEETDRAITRMQTLGAKLIRIMSYKVYEDREPGDQDKAARFETLRRIVDRFLDAGLQPVHENCMNFGGMGWEYTQELLDNVPGLKLVYDTGNPVFLADRAQPRPYPRQNPWEFYSHVRDHIAYIHIKDCVYRSDDDVTYTFPGEGDADVKRILADLLGRGYQGGISIEPHMAVVFHDAAQSSDEQVRFNNYVEYGRRLESLVASL
ncbi:MAG: sugar phosphate isomerase/epimerase [Phycisphaerales bacterium]|nr:sugar phosphate isomerase/epimerase [Phycisphaerales bacterium]